MTESTTEAPAVETAESAVETVTETPADSPADAPSAPKEPDIAEIKERIKAAASPKKEPEKKPEPEVVEKKPSESDDEEEDDSGVFYKRDAEGKFVKKGKAVPLGKYKKAEQEVESLRLEIAKIQGEREAERKQRDEGIEALLKLKGDDKPADEEVIEYDPLDTDADRFYKAEIAKARKELKEEIDRLKEEVKTKDAEQKDKETKNVLLGAQNLAVAQKEAFRAKTPDFDDAVNHLIGLKFDELAYLHSDEASLNQAVAEGMYHLVLNMIARGEDSAAGLYKLAQKSGYKAKEPETRKTGANLNKIDENKNKTVNIGAVKAEPVQADRFRPLSTEEFREKFGKFDDKGRLLGINTEEVAKYKKSMGMR